MFTSSMRAASHSIGKICVFGLSVGKQTMLSYRFLSAAQNGNFQDFIAFRKKQSEHSVFVEMPSSNHCDMTEIYSSCGKVKEIINWENSTRGFSLVEFHERCAVSSLLRKCSYQGTRNGLPTFSRLVYSRNIEKSAENNQFVNSGESNQHMQKSSEKCMSVSEESVVAYTVNTNHTWNTFVSEQMNSICKASKLKDVDIRLRFLLCTVLEDTMKGVLPYGKFIPVGSTVNGFGNLNGNLDMIFALNTKLNLSKPEFCHPSKKILTSYKDVDAHILSTISDIFETFLPGISGLKRCMLTNPPFVTFNHHLLDLKCCFSVNNMSLLYISEILFLCAKRNSCVRPLVFTVKEWAHVANITRSSHDNGITDFALTYMVIFFLQTRPQPVLPALDQVCGGDATSCFEEESNEAIDSLLKEFFNFIGTFPFKNKSISVSSAKSDIKPDFSPLYIHDQLNQQLNLCKYVTQEELDQLIRAANCAFWNLETSSLHDVTKSKGLLEILLSNVDQVMDMKC